MRYPLPYAFARTQQLLLEEQGGAFTLWLHPASPASGVSEVMRKYPGCQIEPQPAEVLIQRISAQQRGYQSEGSDAAICF